MNTKRICILGGSGFVGRHLVTRLAANQGLQLRIVTRNPKNHRDLLTRPDIELVTIDPFDPCQLQRLFSDCETVINLVGILNESNLQQNFRRLHVELVAAIIAAAEVTGVKQFLHMSALHANATMGPSRYLYTKGEGETLAHTRGSAFMEVTSFRPSVIFGPRDSFFNRFAGLLRFAPGVFPLACANSRFQPVFIDDVVEAFTRAIGNADANGRCYNLCGPKIFTLNELVAYTAQLLGKRVRIIALSDALARIQGHLLGNIPGQPFSYDNYLSLKVDSICEANDLAALGINPRAIEEIVPAYIKKS